MSITSEIFTAVPSSVITPIIGGGGVAPVTCADLTFSEMITTNSSGAFVGQTLTVTNDGGGSGVYGAQSITSWQSATGEVSFEVKYKSKTGTLTAGDVIGILIRQGGVDLVGVAMVPSVGYVYDIIATTFPETGLTMVEDVYTLGLTLNQAAGTATYTDSLGNTGALTVGGGYDNSIYTSVGAVINTSTSNVLVGEYHTSPSTFTLGLSGGWCSYTTTTQIANYAFTSDLDTISGNTATYSVEPSFDADGVILVSGTDLEAPTTGFPVNDFTWEFDVTFNENAAVAVVASTDVRTEIQMRSSGIMYFARYYNGSTSQSQLLVSGFGNVSGRTFNIVATQSSTTGISLDVTEVGGLEYSASGNLNNTEDS